MPAYTEPCPHCGADLDFGQVALEAAMLREAAAAGELYVPDACCDEFAGDLADSFDQWTPGTFDRLDGAPAGVKPRAILTTADGRACADINLRVEPVDFATAAAFVGRHHRHNAAPEGWYYGFGCYNGSELIGVVTVGQPVARCTDWYVYAAEVLPVVWAAALCGVYVALPYGFAAPVVTAEVNRLCVTASAEHPGLVWNACSMLYGAAAREARRRGFARIITYTLQTEPGDTLKAAGWQTVAPVRGRSWAGTRDRVDDHDTGDKWRWEVRLQPRRSDAARLVTETLARRARKAARRAARQVAQLPVAA